MYQVIETLKQIFTPGVSRHELKARGLADERITGIRTMQDYVKTCCRFARWCKTRYGGRHIRRITPEMAERYVAELRDKELSGGYIGKARAAIRKLDVAMRAGGYRPRDATPLLQPGGGRDSHGRAERAYTSQQAEPIIGDMREHARDKQAADVARLQRVVGLRITEAVMIRGQDIDPQTCTVREVKGTKGGKTLAIRTSPAHPRLSCSPKSGLPAG